MIVRVRGGCGAIGTGVSRRVCFGFSVAATDAAASRTGIWRVTGLAARAAGVTGGSGFFSGGVDVIAFVRARTIGASVGAFATLLGISRLSTDCEGAAARPLAEPSKSIVTSRSSGSSTSHGSGFSPNCCFMYVPRLLVDVRSWAAVANASIAWRISSAVW